MSKKVIAAAAMAGAACLTGGMAAAQTVNTDAARIIKSMPAGSQAWFGPVLNQALSFIDSIHTPIPGGTLPPFVVPQSENDFDQTGSIGSYQPSGPTVTAKNAFFQSLGTNGRTCFSCHQMSSGMSINTTTLQNLYRISGDLDPVFAAIDGANCPDKPHDHSLLLNKGLFRIFLPVPAVQQDGVTPVEFTVTVVSNPIGNDCNKNPTYSTGVDPKTGKQQQILSFYRRARMSGNLLFAINAAPLPPGAPPCTNDPITGACPSGNIMWDGREKSLFTQAVDATLGHAQAKTSPTDDQVKQMINFELGIYNAQLKDLRAGSLNSDGANGGPVYLSQLAAKPGQIPPVFIFGAPSFDLYDAWGSSSSQLRASIKRGQDIFNGKTKPFTLSRVAGLTEGGNIPGVGCSFCHSQQDSGADAIPKSQLDIGIAGDSHNTTDNGPAPTTDLPIFQVTCNGTASHQFHGKTILTNDLGLAMQTGKCEDVGKFTTPQVRAVAARAPYFSDGSAQTLLDVVNFYNTRFNIGLSDQDKQDLVNFLAAL